MLNSDAPLVADREVVVVNGQPGDAGSVDRQCGGRAGSQRESWVGELDRAWCGDLQAERDVGSGVVHVVALNALIHDAEAATDDGLASTRQVVGKTQSGTKRRPVIAHQALGNSVLARDADSVQVQRNARKNRVG